MKKILAFILAFTLLFAALVGSVVSVKAESNNDMFFDLAFGVSQSGHIEKGATNYYKFTLDSYTTLTIDYDSTDEDASGFVARVAGRIFVFKASDYNDMLVGKEYKTYFSADTTNGNDKCTWYDGKMSLYAGTYYLAIKPMSYYRGSSGSNNYTISVTPTVIKLTKIGFSSSSSSVKLNWTGDLGAVGYQVQRKSGDSYKTIKTTGAVSYTDKGLKPGTIYYYRVRGYVKVAGKNYYGAWHNITAVTKPNAPTIKTPATNSKHQIIAKWGKVSACSGYQVQIGNKKNFAATNVTKTVSGNTKTSLSVKMKKGKTYYVRVRSYKVLNGKKYYSGWSKTKSIKCK